MTTQGCSRWAALGVLRHSCHHERPAPHPQDRKKLVCPFCSLADLRRLVLRGSLARCLGRALLAFISCSPPPAHSCLTALACTCLTAAHLVSIK